MDETSARRQYLGMSRRSFYMTLATVLLGLVLGAFIDLFSWLSDVDFFEDSSLLEIGRDHRSALAWIRFVAYAGVLAGMAFGVVNGCGTSYSRNVLLIKSRFAPDRMKIILLNQSLSRRNHLLRSSARRAERLWLSGDATQHLGC